MSSRAIRGPSPLAGPAVVRSDVEDLAGLTARPIVAVTFLGLAELAPACFRNQRRRVSSETFTPIFESTSTMVRSDAPAARSRNSPTRSRSRTEPLVFLANWASATSSENLWESFGCEMGIVWRVCGNHVAAVWHGQAVNVESGWKNLSENRLDVGV